MTIRHLLFIGDSLANGVGLHYSDGNATNKAIDGSLANSWVGQVRPLVQHYHPSIVVVSLGMNHSQFSRFPGQLAAIREEIDGRTVVWFLPPVMPAELEVRRQNTILHVSAIAQEHRDQLFDLDTVGAQRAPDHVHFAWGSSGYGKLASGLKSFVATFS
ncbi:MAG: hypothetical protein H6842_11260 [Rhodospirillaceae bacterium]|nr:hypothetical protein [Rhodospirillaceae bacterium]